MVFQIVEINLSKIINELMVIFYLCRNDRAVVTSYS
jgi:hypothetical protein